MWSSIAGVIYNNCYFVCGFGLFLFQNDIPIDPACTSTDEDSGRETPLPLALVRAFFVVGSCTSDALMLTCLTGPGPKMAATRAARIYSI